MQTIHILLSKHRAHVTMKRTKGNVIYCRHSAIEVQTAPNEFFYSEMTGKKHEKNNHAQQDAIKLC